MPDGRDSTWSGRMRIPCAPTRSLRAAWQWTGPRWPLDGPNGEGEILLVAKLELGMPGDRCRPRRLAAQPAPRPSHGKNKSDHCPDGASHDRRHAGFGGSRGRERSVKARRRHENEVANSERLSTLYQCTRSPPSATARLKARVKGRRARRAPGSRERKGPCSTAQGQGQGRRRSRRRSRSRPRSEAVSTQGWGLAVPGKTIDRGRREPWHGRGFS